MHPFRRILLATEGTEFDVGAERVALALARTCGQPLDVVLPLASNPEYEAVAPGLAARTEREAAERLAALRAAAGRERVSLRVRVRRGEEPYREIVGEAAESAADVMVIRRRGKRGFLAKLLVGEMVSKVIANCPCSVLAVPRAAAMWSRGIVAATDGSPEGAAALDAAAALAQLFVIPLHVLDLSRQAGSAGGALTGLDDAVRRMREAGINVTASVVQDSAGDALGAAMRSCGADLLVIAHGGVGAVRRSAETILGQAETPVLIVRPPMNRPATAL